MKRVLIDSDVCLDVFLRRNPFVKQSAQILSAAEQGKITAFVSGIAFNKIFYVLRKNSDQKRALQSIRKLRTLVSVGVISEDTIDQALDSDWRDFEDAMQYWCAKEAECEAIVTRKTNDNKNSEIPVFSPSGFLRAAI